LSGVPGLPEYPTKLEYDGKYADVPVITGNTRDEGGLWGPLPQFANVTTASALQMLIAGADERLSAETVSALLAYYPEDPGAGSPFGLNSSM
jgi:hypothetical protein